MRQNYQISEQFPSQEEEEALKFPLFARKKYWVLHLAEEKILPILVRNDQHQILGFWCFYHSNLELSTPFNAPFFTFYVSDSRFEATVFSEIISFCKKRYKLPVRVTVSSLAFLHSIQNLVSPCLIANISLGTRLAVSSDSFFSKIKRVRKIRKLNSLLADDAFKVSEVAAQDWGEVYNQNLKWRKEKGHHSYMSLEQMQKAKNVLPKAYKAIQLSRNEVLVGTCFFVVVDSNLIYVYSLVTAPKVDAKEPALLLWKAIFDYARSINISAIDMGTSMLPTGKINKNLASYKQYIGGEHYRKYTIQC